MLAKNILNSLILPLEIHQTGYDALNRMDDYHIGQLPVISNGEYFNLIREDEIFEYNLPDTPLKEFTFSSRIPPALSNQHLLEVLEIMAEYNLEIIAVVNEKNMYQGCISLYDILKALYHLDMIQNPGGILVLELNLHDYSLTQIAQILEANDAKVLGLYTISPPDSTKVEVTLKINLLDLSPIIATFNRYDYIIKASFGQSDWDDLLRDRYDSLMNFLNI
ncbi:MAG TPA: CBS domain-containing protein [Bacteroidales bacterium]|jgi:predicted transcriptional regulator|nr:CBS domain-containing protein [Bacteroidales bacterium]MDI9573265.1 CBS domain-containing protein [Bacteroidota bacterium]OQC59296.1 MAG: CBS domain protein [Bacteroidetes bacterium ADurb.Bin012]MBP9511293.1 CBS domain-containing protein [Bacteroidales bacterium]MBP9588970.1 CBS domain-containing protein [Bacteroidales bacterium]